ncbi:MAG: CRISPR-associated protein Csx11, partial [Caldilineaceae bacterium]
MPRTRRCGMTQLEKLAQHQNTILLAEAIGWLHDYRKCSEEQLQAQSANTTAQGISRNELTNRFNSLTTTALVFSSVMEQLPNLLNQWSGQANSAAASFLRQYLSRCHNTAHFDKQEPLDSSKQNYPGTQISTAFGFERAVGANLSTQLWALPWNNLTTYNVSQRNSLLSDVQTLFATVGADTRRPVNEINLWDWGMLVGALYKTAIATVVLGQQPANRDLRWQLFSIRTDALTYLTNVSRLPDLMARQDTLQNALNKVQRLLEVDYPLATEVYRDENGALYVVPDLDNLLNFCDGSNLTLLSLIQNQFATDGEIAPAITLDSNPWWGQDPDRNGNDKIPPAGSILASSATWQSNAAIIREAWTEKRQTVCPICGLRPCVNRQLDYCQICGERRKGRIQDWLQNQGKTIWMDEVADRNGRLALITGTFDLTNWLDGSLVETLLVQEPTASNLPVTKTPSFARIRRVWQTTKTFWQETQRDTDHHLRDARRRLLIKLANSPTLTQYQVYELDLLGATRMSVLWDGNHLISTDNLSYTAVQLGMKPEERKTPADAALAVGAWLEDSKRKNFQLISDDEKNRQVNIQLADVDYQDVAYSTTIPILAEPRTFMALVPANKALAVIDAIKTKYEREMGKVRNRLPLHLGAVYFHRRTPLRAALDAGRRMLKYEGGKRKDEPWIVQQDAQKGSLPAEQKRLQEQEKGQFTQTILVQLQQADRSLTWHV